MEGSPLYKYTELVSLRKIETEFWNTLEANLKECPLDKINLKPLVKLQRGLNNSIMKMIARTADEIALAKQPPVVDAAASEAPTLDDGFEVVENDNK
jgi:hypothetical protein